MVDGIFDWIGQLFSGGNPNAAAQQYAQPDSQGLEGLLRRAGYDPASVKWDENGLTGTRLANAAPVAAAPVAAPEKPKDKSGAALLGNLIGGGDPDVTEQYKNGRLTNILLGLGGGLGSLGPSRLPVPFAQSLAQGALGVLKGQSEFTDEALHAAQTGSAVSEASYKKMQTKQLAQDMELLKIQLAAAMKKRDQMAGGGSGGSGSIIEGAPTTGEDGDVPSMTGATASGKAGWGPHAADAIDELTALGAKPAAIQAAMANGLGEGGFNTNWLKARGDENSFGHWQLNAKGELPNFMSNEGKDGQDTRSQARFIYRRLNEIQPGFWQMDDPQKATDIFATKFERYKGAAPGQRYALLADAQAAMGGNPQVRQPLPGVPDVSGRFAGSEGAEYAPQPASLMSMAANPTAMAGRSPLSSEAAQARPVSNVLGGRSSATVLAELQKIPPDQLRGAHVVLSTGVSNDRHTGDYSAVQKQFEYLKNAGAKVSVVGMGTNYGKENPIVQQMAQDAGFSYIPAGANDGLHMSPAGYAGVARQAITTNGAPTHVIGDSLGVGVNSAFGSMRPTTAQSGGSTAPAAPAPSAGGNGPSQASGAPLLANGRQVLPSGYTRQDVADATFNAEISRLRGKPASELDKKLSTYSLDVSLERDKAFATQEARAKYAYQIANDEKRAEADNAQRLAREKRIGEDPLIKVPVRDKGIVEMPRSEYERLRQVRPELFPDAGLLGATQNGGAPAPVAALPAAPAAPPGMLAQNGPVLNGGVLPPRVPTIPGTNFGSGSLPGYAAPPPAPVTPPQAPPPSAVPPSAAPPAPVIGELTPEMLKTREEELKRETERKKIVVEGTGKEFFSDVRPKAQSAIQSLQNNLEVRRLISEGIISGSKADFKMATGKFLHDNLGIGTDKNISDIARTEEYAARLAKDVLDKIKTLGANPSEGDRKFLQEMVGSNPNLDKRTLVRLLSMHDKVNREYLEDHNEKAKAFQADSPYELHIKVPDRVLIPMDAETRTGAVNSLKGKTGAKREQIIDYIKNNGFDPAGL